MGVNIIVAVGRDGAIGKGGDLIWKIPSDLKRFKALTTGHPVIMGRKTWESLPKKPLPNRRNIVLTHKNNLNAQGAEIVTSPEEALRVTAGEDIFVIGGAEIYREFLPFTDTLFLTEVDSTCDQADAFLNIDLSEDWNLIEESPVESTPDGIPFVYRTYRRS